MPLYSLNGETASIMALAPVIPVLTVASVEDGVAQAKALVAGGLYAIEVTLRTPSALAAIREIAESVPRRGRRGRHDRFGRSDRRGGRGRSAVSGQPRRSAGARQGRGAIARAIPAGLRDRVGGDGAAGARLSRAEALSRRSGRAARGCSHRSPRRCPICASARPAASTSRRRPSISKLPNVPCVGGSWMLPKAALAAGDYAAVEALSRERGANCKRAAV